MMKFKKIVLTMGLIAGFAVKIVASDHQILIEKQSKNAAKLIDSICGFFKEKLQHSIINDYIRTSKQVGNNIINKAKNNIEILNYWDVAKENGQLKENQREILQSFQDSLNQNQSTTNLLITENEQLKKTIITEQAEKTVLAKKLGESEGILQKIREGARDLMKNRNERNKISEQNAMIAGIVCSVIIIGTLIFNYFKKDNYKETEKMKNHKKNTVHIVMVD